MTRRFLLSIIVVLLITNVATLLLWSRDGEQQVVDIGDGEKEVDRKKAVATIGKEEISFDEWMQAMRNTHGERQLKGMIDREVVSQLAHKKDIKVHDKVIEREIAYLTSMQGIRSKKEMEKQITKWKSDIVYRYQLEALLTEDVRIPEEELKAYFDGYHKQYDFSTSIQLSHIVVNDMETAKKVKRELDEGASFALLAREYTTDEESKKDGGYLGYFTETSQFLPDGYYDQALNMKQHTYSEPFAVGNGAAIIYLHRFIPEIQFSYEELKPYIKSELALEKMEQSLTADPLWKELKVDWIYNEK
ncbi:MULTISPECIES: peptidylprolyl isomerase [unclassified Virgibacillus]|uniref:peptidylprolyl isomerase n=1 Tax=unclassified Virgibacillus TaxID=2620237 RepID=UPI0024DED761|nr:peptidylprolyl isomerase [Virgibacillus sp. LDC-1]